jgi:hypothetical protein
LGTSLQAPLPAQGIHQHLYLWQKEQWQHPFSGPHHHYKESQKEKDFAQLKRRKASKKSIELAKYL